MAVVGGVCEVEIVHQVITAVVALGTLCYGGDDLHLAAEGLGGVEVEVDNADMGLVVEDVYMVAITFVDDG